MFVIAAGSLRTPRDLDPEIRIDSEIRVRHFGIKELYTLLSANTIQNVRALVFLFYDAC